MLRRVVLAFAVLASAVACGGGGADVFVRWYNQFGTALGTRTYVSASGLGAE